MSDYHIGAGYGKGIVDSAILKDKNGRPIVRGTTLAGLLRHGMWDLLQLDLLKQHRKCKESGTSGDSYCLEADEKKMCPICRILGAPAHPKKWKISSAEIENPPILRAENIVWRNRVNPKTRTAEAGKLFSEEDIGGKIHFIFILSNESNDVQTLEEASFIVAAFRMVKHIGSSRRRGKGSCRIHLIDIIPESVLEDTKPASKEDKLLNIFKIKWLEDNELNIPGKNIQSETEGIQSPTKKSFDIIFLTKEPLLIANRSESGNKFQTSNYIPGYTILGALAWKVANRCDLDNEDVYEKFINLFRRGEIKLSPLYPCWKIEDDIYPTVPSPQDFLTCKLNPEFEEDGHGIKNFAIEKDEPKNCDKCREKGLETPLEPLNKFVSLYEKPKTVDVVKREEMHITIEPETGRTKTGELFSYIVIESEQYFIGTIDIENWEDFSNLLGIDSQENSFELRVGKASSRGYGLTRIWLNEENLGKTFLGMSIEARVEELTEPLTMTLITDTILVDNWGRFYNTLDKEILSQLLGVEVEIINKYVKSRNIDGFNTYLGLPKWRDSAIAAGSSFGFKIKTSEISNDLLKHLGKLEGEGIGSRREEGFGKIAFNHPVYNKNAGVSVRINLPAFMRISKVDEPIKNFERWWRTYLAEKLHQKDFAYPEWIAVARWLRENSKKSIEEITNLLSNFHSPEKLTELVRERSAYREKKKFLEDKGKKVFQLLLKLFTELLERLATEKEENRQYLHLRAIEMLADFIAPLKEKGT